MKLTSIAIVILARAVIAAAFVMNRRSSDPPISAPGPEQPASATPAEAPAAPETRAIGVDELMKNVDKHRGPVTAPLWECVSLVNSDRKSRQTSSWYSLQKCVTSCLFHCIIQSQRTSIWMLPHRVSHPPSDSNQRRSINPPCGLLHNPVQAPSMIVLSIHSDDCACRIPRRTRGRPSVTITLSGSPAISDQSRMPRQSWERFAVANAPSDAENA
jgi:hypothetical protein